MASRSMDYGPTYKILVLGESGVGKTSIIRRFTDAQYQDSYISTIGIDSRSKSVTIEEEKIRLQIWDTAGQERFRTITSAYYRGAMGVVLVYDMTAEASFSSISNWLETIEQNASPNVCRILVGNKSDCPKEKRIIEHKKGRERAESSGLKFFEASAKEGHNVEEAFMTLANMIKETKKRIKESKEQSIRVVSELDDHGGRCC